MTEKKTMGAALAMCGLFDHYVVGKDHVEEIVGDFGARGPEETAREIREAEGALEVLAGLGERLGANGNLSLQLALGDCRSRIREVAETLEA